MKDIDLSECVLMNIVADKTVNVESTENKVGTSDLPLKVQNDHMTHSSVSPPEQLPLLVTRERLIAAQRTDSSLRPCYAAVVSNKQCSPDTPFYYIDDKVFMCKWSLGLVNGADWDVTHQIVVPAAYCEQVLYLAHELPWSGHLGVNKAYDLILKNLFWPGLKSVVKNHCCTCHVCQLAGKPNQIIPPASLNPIPATGKPLERVIVDCVGPLP